MVWDKKKKITLNCIVKHNEQLYDQLGCMITMVQSVMITMLYNYNLKYLTKLCAQTNIIIVTIIEIFNSNNYYCFFCDIKY